MFILPLGFLEQKKKLVAPKPNISKGIAQYDELEQASFLYFTDDSTNFLLPDVNIQIDEIDEFDILNFGEDNLEFNIIF